jgi:branched-chain amino acid aminotransferase
MLNLEELTVYINGRFVPGNQATISVFDRGLLFGDAVFEGIREYSGRVFKLDEHVDRLYDSARIISLTIPLSKEEMKQAILETLRRNRLQDAHMRPIVTRGVGALGVGPGRDVNPTVIIFAHPWKPFLGDQGIALKTAAVRRTPPECIDSRVKHTGYLNNILAKLEADAAGANEALLLDVHGFVTEGPGENFLLIRGGAMVSPTTTNILNGITRRTVMELARQAGLRTEERNLTLGDVYTADEALVCGTGAEIVPVVRVDGRPIGSGEAGPVTRSLMTAFRQLVQQEGTPVY